MILFKKVIIKLEVITMKKAISYMMIGALGVAAYYMYMDNKCLINSKMRKLKRVSMDACDKVKAMM